jgi:large subunit ribosomal protein L25
MRVVLRAFVPVVLNELGDHEGVLQVILQEVEVEALPANLPSQIDVDASSLAAVGDALHVSDLVAPEDVTIVTAEEELIASLVAQAVEPEPEDEVGAEEGEEGAEGEDGEAAEPSDGGDSASADSSED